MNFTDATRAIAMAPETPALRRVLLDMLQELQKLQARVDELEEKAEQPDWRERR